MSKAVVIGREGRTQQRGLEKEMRANEERKREIEEGKGWMAREKKAAEWQVIGKV